LFSKYDKSENSTLELDEFAKLLKKIDKSLNDEEIQSSFKKFDCDGDEKIDFKEFYAALDVIENVCFLYL
jgi:Ca2+-binding EF-hand superfamily protein